MTCFLVEPPPGREGWCIKDLKDDKKDLEPLLVSKSKFEFIVKNYPNTDFAQDAQYKINLIKDVTPLPHNGCRPPAQRRV